LPCHRQRRRRKLPANSPINRERRKRDSEGRRNCVIGELQTIRAGWYLLDIVFALLAYRAASGLTDPSPKQNANRRSGLDQFCDTFCDTATVSVVVAFAIVGHHLFNV
jgi:hypothetical protein